MYQHILIPTDGSKLSERAAVAGVKLAAALEIGRASCRERV